MSVVTPLQSGDLELARRRAEDQTRDYPEFPISFNLLGIIHREFGDMDLAENALARAVELRPDYAEAQNNLGIVLRARGRKLEAAKCYRAALQQKPNYPEALNNLAGLLVDFGEIDDAVAAYEKALSLTPDYVDALGNLGALHLKLANTTQANTLLRRALHLDPDFAVGYQHLVVSQDMKNDAPLVSQMENALRRANSAKNKAALHFSLGKAYDDCGDTKQAFRHFTQANKAGAVPYSLADDVTLFAKIKSDFSSKFNEAERGNLDSRPIFIVGMPRSGTSLVEQILASHSEVDGLGELDAFSVSLEGVRGDFQGVRNRYLSQLPRRQNEVFTDKMPLNFRWIGHILMAFPEAKIVHCARDARAVGWSIFRSPFMSGGNGYRYRLVDIADFTALYLDLMEFWHRKFPGRIYDIDYNRLTEDQEHESRALLDFVGLDWENQVMNFAKTKRLVNTVSVAQVRRDMYQGSSDAWRAYEAYLPEFLERLAKIGPKTLGH